MTTDYLHGLLAREKELAKDISSLAGELKALKDEHKRISTAVNVLSGKPKERKPTVSRDGMIAALRAELERNPTLDLERVQERAVERLKSQGTSRGWHLVIKPALRALDEEGLLASRRGATGHPPTE